MPLDTRCKNTNWQIHLSDDRSKTASVQDAQLAVLMDIRDELQRLNEAIQCPNFYNIPSLLRQIRHNTRRQKPSPQPLRRPIARRGYHRA